MTPELSGGRRDAMALWALFTDTIEGPAARRLADEEATHSEAADATILVTLESAQGDNVIVIPGSPDARDTPRNDCGRTLAHVGQAGSHGGCRSA